MSRRGALENLNAIAVSSNVKQLLKRSAVAEGGSLHARHGCVGEDPTHRKRESGGNGGVGDSSSGGVVAQEVAVALNGRDFQRSLVNTSDCSFGSSQVLLSVLLPRSIVAPPMRWTTRAGMACFGVLPGLLAVEDRRSDEDKRDPAPVVVIAPHHGVLEGLFVAQLGALALLLLLSITSHKLRVTS